VKTNRRVRRYLPAHHRPVAVIDLAFFPGHSADHHARVGCDWPTKFGDESFDARVSSRETMILDQVLVDRRRIAAVLERREDQLAIRLADAGIHAARRRRVGGHPGWRNCRFCRGVGGHPRRNCRFCRLFARPPAAPHRDARRAQVRADCDAMHARGLRDALQGPPQATERQNLLLSMWLQDVAHLGEGLHVPRLRQRLGTQLIVGFEVSTNCRFWVSTEGSADHRGQFGRQAISPRSHWLRHDHHHRFW
jgi:hypothetical protein